MLLIPPTLFGVTVVSFCIMQLAPGDPMLSQLGAGGNAGQSNQTRDAYVLQKRDLKLDKPLLFNFRYFYNYTSDVQNAAFFRLMSEDQISDELVQLAADNLTPEQRDRLKFLRSLGISGFNRELRPRQLTASELRRSGLTEEQWQEQQENRRKRLAGAIRGYLQSWLEDVGIHGVPPAMALLEDKSQPLELRIGAASCLSAMVVNPFVYTYSRDATPQERELVPATWARLWHAQKDEFPPLDPDRAAALQAKLATLATDSRTEMFRRIQSSEFNRNDAPFFAEVLLGDAPLADKEVAAEFLRLYVSARVKIDVPADATAEELQQVADNWQAHYDAAKSNYFPGMAWRVWAIVGDTQYAHMIVRLATLRFGRSALKTREWVFDKILNAVIVSAPLMLMAQLVIYFTAIPLGVICANNRGNFVDRAISLLLFLLYSVPPFVAAMLFLLYFCYGDYLKLFPMERLHAPGAENMTYWHYFLDYLWHAFLPVVCLSLFSLAGMAMYSRAAMLDVLGQDYIRTAKAKGVSGPKVLFKHAFRNGLIPIITLFANILPAMLGGSVLIEYLFNIPGMGRLSFTSIEQKDFPTLMALIYIQAILVMVSILLTDLLYVFVDPRISFDGRGKSA